MIPSRLWREPSRNYESELNCRVGRDGGGKVGWKLGLNLGWKLGWNLGWVNLAQNLAQNLVRNLEKELERIAWTWIASDDGLDDQEDGVE